MTKKLFNKEIKFSIKRDLFYQLEAKMLVDEVPFSVLFIIVSRMYIENHPDVIKQLRKYQRNKRIFSPSEWKKIRNEDKLREKNKSEFNLSESEKQEIFDLLEKDFE